MYEPDVILTYSSGEEFRITVSGACRILKRFLRHDGKFDLRELLPYDHDEPFDSDTARVLCRIQPRFGVANVIIDARKRWLVFEMGDGGTVVYVRLTDDPDDGSLKEFIT